MPQLKPVSQGMSIRVHLPFHCSEYFYPDPDTFQYFFERLMLILTDKKNAPTQTGESGNVNQGASTIPLFRVCLP
jgi:hypothetical protein